MAGNLHKLSAGDGYTYLTKQVAAMDSSERGAATLADYYSMKGEAPGRWTGAGLTGLEGISAGDTVTEDQMKALFGLGRHPNARQIEDAKIAELVDTYFRHYIARGFTTRTAQKKAADRAATEALKYSRLGSPFRVFAQASDFRQAVAQAFSDYNVARGLKWNTVIPAADRARIRTEIGRQRFRADYDRAPLDERELSGYIARHSRQRTQACAGYDFTCTPVKSISALWALAPRPIADIVRQCHDDAVADAIRFIEQHAAYTRTGPNGVAQIDVTGVIAAVFVHRDSRAGDPQLHTHIALSNKVQALDGRWFALDGRPLYKFAVWASEHYNTRVETYLRQRLGVRFAERPHKDPNKRGTREIVGIDQGLCDRWSTRNNNIEARRGQLARAFQLKYGREPSPREAYEIAERAALDERPGKHDPRTESEQRHTWHDEATAHFGTRHGVSAMVEHALHPDTSDTDAPAPHRLDAWIEAAADDVIARISEQRSSWQVNHVGAETERLVRAADLDPADIDSVIERVVDAALAPSRCFALPLADRFVDPAELTRRDGSSVFVPAATQSYTSAPVMAAEQRILDAAQRRDGHRVSDLSIDLALLEYTANQPGRPLNAGQVALVRAFATSGARVEVALAPAGTGKTTAMAVFARAWHNDGGTVVGLAPTANAAAVLRDEIGTTCDTIDKLIDSLRLAEFATATGIPVRIPHWVDDIDASTVVVIDEAALASTYQLDQVIGFVLDRGGSVKLVGDDKQLAAISAGGIVRAIADAHGAHTLGHVIRFRDRDGNVRADEAAASLALRDGDPAAIGFYLDHGRVHGGDAVAATDHAYAAWADDRRAGLDSVMMAPTHDITRELNCRARDDRLAVWGSTGREITLRDDTQVSAGDVIRTTENNRRLATSGTDWVRNGYRWSVDTVHDDGSLSVTHLRTGLSIVLPAWYVDEHVMLGYASTIMTSQGITADTSHTVVSGNETRNDIYMALTRGARENHLYVPTALGGDEYSVVTDKALNPDTAIDFFTRMLARDGSQKAVTTLLTELADPHTRLAHAVDAYLHAVGAAAETLLGEQEMARIDDGADTIHNGLTDEAAWPTLRRHLAVIALSGTDPLTALQHARDRRELDSAYDPAAVLDWRLDTTGNHSAGTGPLPWLTGIPHQLATDPTFGEYLTARFTHVTALADHVAADARSWTTPQAPPWARPLVGDNTTRLLADLAVWRAAGGIPAEERRPTGPNRLFIRERRHQRLLDHRVAAVLGDPAHAAARWKPLANRIDARLTHDPYWPVLADRLTTAARAGIDVPALVESIATDHPLPDELPAAALWWRLTPHLPPTDDNTTANTPLADELVPPDPLADGAAPRHTAPDIQPATTEPDEDYLTAVLADPPEDADAAEPAQAHQRERAGGHRGVIDFDSAATAPAVPYPELTDTERVDQLRADLAAARRRATDLWTTYLAGTGQHRRDAQPQMLALRRRADAQTPYRIAALHAHDLWQAADRAANAAEHAHAARAATLTDAQRSGTETSSLELEVAMLAMEARAARARADDTRTEATHAKQAWDDAAGDDERTTPDHVDALRTAADSLDLATVTDARNEVELLEAQLLRAQNAAARQTAHETSQPDKPAEHPGTRTTTAVATKTRHHRTAATPTNDQARERWRSLTDTKLAAEIDALTQRLHRLHRTGARVSGLAGTAVADRVRADHAQLRTQAQLAATAIDARNQARDIETRWNQARTVLAELTRLRDTGAVHGKTDKRKLHEDITTTTDAVAALRTEHSRTDAARRAAADAAVASGAYPDQWERITARANDPAALTAELNAAINEDTERAERQTRHRTEFDLQVTQLRAALDTARAEQQQRPGVDNDTMSDVDCAAVDTDTNLDDTEFDILETTTVSARTTTRATKRSTRRTGDADYPKRQRGHAM
ncbi:MobF family relaxase [Nocardia blacklockiae]|uniref:MobF family relaxase n=1 Tax=Nocardia blacklockiae TaxID=480036 RepID=UPI00189420DB|nr:MobF family relaxase [Nocardia blacklockiae]MBF6171108.1 relaxase domain-containing protein [Nocardia blacklockiae]